MNKTPTKVLANQGATFSLNLTFPRKKLLCHQILKIIVNRTCDSQWRNFYICKPDNVCRCWLGCKYARHSQFLSAILMAVSWTICTQQSTFLPFQYNAHIVTRNLKCMQKLKLLLSSSLKILETLSCTFSYFFLVFLACLHLNGKCLWNRTMATGAKIIFHCFLMSRFCRFFNH